ncbi:MAG: HAMP domain-containing histidine kinase [Anaerolineae bacterium]|nr:HAMP domain-containing histidine kinase [Anaerolineae bacterium]
MKTLFTAAVIRPDEPFNADVGFLRTLAHQLRTPLNSIVTTAEMLHNQTYGELTPKQKRASERIIRNSDLLLRLIDDAMMFIRASAGALEIDCAPIEFDSVVQAARSFLPAAQQRQNTLTVTVDPLSPATVWGDIDLIKRVLMELLNNANQATSDGQINVEFGAVVEERWQIKVKDTGIGLGVDVRENMWQPFWRGDEFRKAVPSGQGLGLPIIKGLMMLMDGSFTLENASPNGACATLSLKLISGTRI